MSDIILQCKMRLYDFGRLTDASPQKPSQKIMSDIILILEGLRMHLTKIMPDIILQCKMRRYDFGRLT